MSGEFDSKPIADLKRTEVSPGIIRFDVSDGSGAIVEMGTDVATVSWSALSDTSRATGHLRDYISEQQGRVTSVVMIAGNGHSTRFVVTEEIGTLLDSVVEHPEGVGTLRLDFETPYTDEANVQYTLNRAQETAGITVFGDCLDQRAVDGLLRATAAGDVASHGEQVLAEVFA